MFKTKKRYQRSWEYYGDPNSVILIDCIGEVFLLSAWLRHGQVSSVTAQTELVNCIKSRTRMRESRKEDEVQEVVVEFVKWDKLLHNGYRVFPTCQAAGALTTHPRSACKWHIRD